MHEANIQVATIEHLDALVALENACFTVPWSHKSFEAELQGNQFSKILIIPRLEDGQKSQVIGYICVWIIFEEIRLLNVAVHLDFRRRGFAKKLIEEALHLGMKAGCCRGMLEVRETNVAAIKLYQYFHFEEYARRKSYYTNPTEDAILMTREPLASLENERRDEGGDIAGSQMINHTFS